MQAETTEERRQKYRAYLASPEWARKRLAALARAGHRCQVCNSPSRLDVHHRTYERIFNEDPGDLTVLCRKCHERHHAAPKKRKPKKRKQPPKLAGARDVRPLKGEPIKPTPAKQAKPPSTPQMRKAAHQQRAAALKVAAVAADPFAPKCTLAA